MDKFEDELTAELGGHRHFVYAGGNVSGPLVLLAHGGPGYSELPMIGAGTYSLLQREALLVTWDQRGAGRSYSESIEPETMTVARLLEDAVELVNWARKRFQRDRVHLLGHSWGGCLALLLARRVPQSLESVYALCPFVNLHRSAAVAHATLVEQAHDRDDAEAIRELRGLGAPPYRDLPAALGVHTKWIVEYGGMVHGGPARAGELFKRFDDVPGYTTEDYERAAKGQKFSGSQLIDECATLDALELVPALEIPLTVGVGRHDLVNATEITLSWFDQVEAPSKRLHVFEHSVHFPNFCEPDAFQSSALEWLGKAMP